MKKIFVGNVEYQTSEEHLAETFAEVGAPPSKVTIPRDRETGRTKGFAFVEVNNEDFEAALKVNGQLLNGRSLRVNEARTPPR